jgi:hypothetical protein
MVAERISKEVVMSNFYYQWLIGLSLGVLLPLFLLWFAVKVNPTVNPEIKKRAWRALKIVAATSAVLIVLALLVVGVSYLVNAGVPTLLALIVIILLLK